jgi:hypothetical protein
MIFEALVKGCFLGKKCEVSNIRFQWPCNYDACQELIISLRARCWLSLVSGVSEVYCPWLATAQSAWLFLIALAELYTVAWRNCNPWQPTGAENVAHIFMHSSVVTINNIHIKFWMSTLCEFSFRALARHCIAAMQALPPLWPITYPYCACAWVTNTP